MEARAELKLVSEVSQDPSAEGERKRARDIQFHAKIGSVVWVTQLFSLILYNGCLLFWHAKVIAQVEWVHCIFQTACCSIFPMSLENSWCWNHYSNCLRHLANGTPGELCFKTGLKVLLNLPDLEVNMKLKWILFVFIIVFFIFYCAHLITACNSYEKYVCFGNLSSKCNKIIFLFSWCHLGQADCWLTNCSCLHIYFSRVRL